MLNRGANIEKKLVIYRDVKIPTGGYLVGWKYYVASTSPCATFAGIWRSVNSTSYKLVSQTKLRGGNSGEKFQFVQTKIVRVQAGDVLSLSTIRDGTCEQSLVSATIGSGTSNTWIIDTSATAISVDQVFSSGTGTTASVGSVSLRAFISGN